MTVPAGALSTTVTFTIDELAVDPATALGATGAGYRIGPAGASLALPLTLTFTPPSSASPAALTAARQAEIGYWLRVYSVTRTPSAVLVQTGSLGDWVLVTVATQRDLQGPFSLSSAQGLAFTATGTVILQFLGDDGSFATYLPQGSITLQEPVAKGAASCSSAGATLELPPSIAEIRESPVPVQFRWGINGQWSLACTDGSSDFVSTNFDTLGITNLRCNRSYVGAYTISPSAVLGTYLIDCGTGGTVTGSWDLRTPP